MFEETDSLFNTMVVKGPVIIYGRGGEGKNKGGPYV